MSGRTWRGGEGRQFSLRHDGERVQSGARGRRRSRWLERCEFFFSSRRRHTRLQGDWSSDVCSSDLCLGHMYKKGGVEKCYDKEFKNDNIDDPNEWIEEAITKKHIKYYEYEHFSNIELIGDRKSVV